MSIPKDIPETENPVGSGSAVEQDGAVNQEPSRQDVNGRPLMRGHDCFHANLLDHISDAIISIDNEKHVTYLNRPAESLYGVHYNDAIGRPLNEIYTWQWLREKDEQESQTALTERGSWQGENIHLLNDGRRIIVESHVSVIRDSQGGKAGLLAVIREITERKQSEEALRKRKDLLDKTQEIAHLGTWVLDLLNNQLSWSEEVYRIFGLEPREFKATYEAFLDVVHPDDREDVNLAYLESVREGKAVYEIEHRVIRKNSGEIRYVYEKCEHVRDAGGNITRSVGMVHDITARKQADEKISHLASFPQNNPNPVIEISFSGRINYANPAASVILTELGMDGTDVRPFIPADLTDTLTNTSTREPRLVEHEIRIKDRVFAECVSILPQFEVCRIYATDITERKLAEEVLKRDEVTLKQHVEEQADRILSVQLELERAKRLSDVGMLAATVAHELRNPLATISMAAYNIRNKTTGKHLDKHLNAIEKKVAESDSIINNLLYYSRIKPPRFEKVSLFEILEECADVLEEKERETVRITKNVDCIQDLFIDADPVQLREVFNNILANAFDALLPGGGEIKIVAACGKENINIGIQDNGKGMEESDLAKVFDPFFTKKSKGTGLGLTVCRQILDMHYGSIEVKSNSGQGTLVTVGLPREGKDAGHGQ
ncbi:PAS domain S-box protein [candidate division FCPU426 bacterium]|nr:PAS domain S-box protein [candidate division FCPU426 bacterium]